MFTVTCGTCKKTIEMIEVQFDVEISVDRYDNRYDYIIIKIICPLCFEEQEIGWRN
jgi:hypothetical protein